MLIYWDARTSLFISVKSQDYCAVILRQKNSDTQFRLKFRQLSIIRWEIKNLILRGENSPKLNHAVNFCNSDKQVNWQFVFNQVTSIFGQVGWATSFALDRYWFTNKEVLELVLAYIYTWKGHKKVLCKCQL